MAWTNRGFEYDEDPRTEPEHEEIQPECIICGSQKCDYFYFNKDDEPVGCSDCIRREEVYEYERT